MFVKVFFKTVAIDKVSNNNEAYACRLLLLLDYAFKYVDNDTAIYWYTTACYSKGFFPEPFFLGQRYGLMIESVLTIPLHWLHVPLWISVPLVSMLICTLPFIIIAVYTWKKDSLTSVLILLIPCLMGLKYDIVTTVPRAFGGSHLITIIGSLLLISSYKGKPFFTQLWHGIGVFLMVLGATANISSITLSAPVICFIIIRDFINGNSFEENLHKHKFIGSLTGLIIGASLYFFFNSFYTTHPDYNFYGSPSYSFSLSAFSNNMSDIRNLFAVLSPTDNLWFVFPVFVVLISLFVLIVRRKPCWQLPFFMIMSVIGVLLFMTMSKTRDFDSNSYLYTQVRLYIFVPYLIAMLLCISTFYENKTVDATKARPFILAAVIVMILIAGLSSFVKIRSLRTALRQGNPALIKGDSFLEIKPVEVILDEAEKTKKVCEDNGIQYVIYMTPFHPTCAYASGAVYYGSFTTYIAKFERRTWIYNELKEVRAEPVKIYAILENNREIRTIPPNVSIVQYLKSAGYER